MSTITIVNVEVTTPTGKRYQQAEVIYKENGETRTKKIMSFANPAVFNVVKDAKGGEQYTITQNKDDKGYWQWTSITSGAEAAGVPANTGQAPSGRNPAPSTGRDFETKDERAERQKLIVRQSSLSNAIATLSPGAKAGLDPNAVLELAEKYVAWVTDAPDLFFEQPNDI